MLLASLVALVLGLVCLVARWKSLASAVFFVGALLGLIAFMQFLFH